MSDRIGRRPVVVWGVIISTVMTFLSAVAPNPFVYGGIRFVVGGVSLSTITCGFNLGSEWVPEGWRAPVSAFLFGICGLAELILVLLSVLVTSVLSGGWRSLTLATASMMVVPASVCWALLP